MLHRGEPRAPLPRRRRPARLATAAAATLLLAACGGGDDDEGSDATLTDITLLTTTTQAPVFEADTTVPTIDDDTTTTTITTTSAASTTTATTLPPDPATTLTETTVETTTTTPEPASPFSIRTDGIGAATFGASPDGVIDFVNSVLGAPTLDTGWVDPFEIGPCGGTQIRQVSWDTLLLEFGDFSNVAEGRQHFYGYYYGDGASPSASPPGLRTLAGLGLGSSVADLLEIHPDVSLFSGDEFLGPNFQINDALRGTVTGLADNDVITSFVGGLPCNG